MIKKKNYSKAGFISQIKNYTGILLDRSVVENMLQYFFIPFIKSYFSASHNPLCHFISFVQFKGFKAFSSTPCKGWDKLIREPRSEDIGANPYHSTRVKHSIYARFGMV